MASSKVVVVVSTNPDLPRAPSISSSSFLLPSHFHQYLPSKNTITMDEILKNIYPAAIEAASKQQQQSTTTTNNNIDDVWKDIVAGGGTNLHDHRYQHQYQHPYHPSSDEGFSTYSPRGDEVTLEDFLVRAGAVPAPATAPFSPHQYPSSSDASHSLPVATVKQHKAVEEKLVLDKAALQKQKRMIKNRESAARSRERKQAYTTELESHVNRLMMENQRLLEEQAAREKQRLKNLKEMVILITEQPRPKRKLRRLNSF